jgi:serine protease Do
MNKRQIFPFFILYVVTIISSIVAVILYVKYYPIESKVITENINKTVVTEKGIEEAIGNVYDAVVTVNSYFGDTKVGTGSGFIYKNDDKGYILTNNHVIQNANNYTVIISTGEVVEANLLGSDEYSDLAVLSIDKSKVTKVATLGDSDAITVGNTVFTVGSPMGEEYSGSVTRGIISGKDRTIEVDDVVTKVIQTDASINPGNSGGPLVNLAGEVIGITSMKLASSEIEGMGFAIPINDVKVYVQSLEKGDRINRPQIGVSLINVTDTYRLYYYQIQVNRNIKSGVVVSNVNSNSPAAKAGLQKGDVIIKIGDKDVKNISKFKYYLYQYNIDDTIEVTYVRDSQQKTVNIKLEGNR